MTGRRAGARPARLLRTAAAFPYLLGLVLLLAVRGPERARAAEEPPIEPAAGYVNDRAGVMDEPSRAKLEAFLDQVEKKTGAQFAVLTVKSTAPITPSEYKVRVFEAWGIGKKGEDNGLLMLVAVEEREVRFETGYGLEGTLTDGFESRVFRNEMRPRIRAGDFAGAISAGMVACAARVAHEKGVTLTWDGRELRYAGSGRARGLPRWVALILVALFVSLVAGIVAANRAGSAGAGLPGPMIGPYRRRRTRNDWWMGGGGFGGGGFGGGGGGGFGGGSFGGFGGGSSGGGGGGGSW